MKSDGRRVIWCGEGRRRKLWKNLGDEMKEIKEEEEEEEEEEE